MLKEQKPYCLSNSQSEASVLGFTLGALPGRAGGGGGEGKASPEGYEQVTAGQLQTLWEAEARTGEPVSDGTGRVAPGMPAPGTSCCACTV